MERRAYRSPGDLPLLRYLENPPLTIARRRKDPLGLFAVRPVIAAEVDMKSSVLIVDDEPTVRMVLTEMLSETEFEALEAESASQALHTLRKAGAGISVLVTDVRMPGALNGLDLAKFARNSWPWIKVIVTTGFPESAQQEMPQNVRFLPKPWEPEQMMSNILGATADFEAVQRVASVH
jgi:DNA-binding NtrC family response regulator